MKLLLQGCAALTFVTSVLAAGAEDLGSEWLPLFDGRYPVHFRGYKKSTYPFNSWKAWNGMLQVVPEGEKVDLLFKEGLTNFEFSVEWKAAPGASSGIIYLVQERLGQACENGLKMALADDEGNLEAKTRAECRTGALYGLLPREEEVVVRPAGQWNKSRIVVRTNMVEHWVNGVKVLTFDLQSETIRSVLSKSRVKESLALGKTGGGFIALEHRGQKFWFRNLFLRKSVSEVP